MERRPPLDPVRLKVQPRPCIVPPPRQPPFVGSPGGWGRWGDDSFDLGAELARRQRAGSTGVDSLAK